MRGLNSLKVGCAKRRYYRALKVECESARHRKSQMADRDLRQRTLLRVNDHAARVLTGFHIGKRLGRIVQRIGLGDQPVEFELAGFIQA